MDAHNSIDIQESSIEIQRVTKVTPNPQQRWVGIQSRQTQTYTGTVPVYGEGAVCVELMFIYPLVKYGDGMCHFPKY
jgi:hypothetical protein